MAEHEYDDAPLWTVLSTLATMPEGDVRIIDLARNVRTSSGWPGAYRAIARLVSAGYAVIEGGEVTRLSTSVGHRATVRLTATGLARFRGCAGYVKVDSVDRVNLSGGFGVVHRRKWVPRPRQTR